MQTTHLQRVSDAHKHGDATVRKALSSNSLQRFDNSNNGNGKGGNGNGNNNGENGQGNKKKGKKNGKNDNTPSTSSDNTNGASTSSSSSTSTSSNSSAAPLDKKLKRRLVMAVSCSVCGFEAGHSDLDCFKNPDTDESKKAVAENRKDARMKDFFKNIDNAKRKRI